MSASCRCSELSSSALSEALETLSDIMDRSQDYFAIQAQEMNALPTYSATGIAASNASSRISYFFNWHGVS